MKADGRKEAEVKHRLFRGMTGILMAGVVASLAVLAACGGSGGEADPVATAVQAPPAVVQAPPTTVPDDVPVEVPIPEPTAAVAPPPTSAVDSPVEGSSDADLLAQGKVIFEETAGGVGCAWCHGLDGKGNGPSGVGAPANRGKSKDLFEAALAGGETEAMTFIKLTKAEKTAVLAYLQFLDTLP